MPIRDALQRDLAVARQAKDTEKVSLLRTLIAAIENAEAVDSDEVRGITEVTRRHVTDVEIREIIMGEAGELRDAAAVYERAGRVDQARRLRSLADVADGYSGTIE